MSNQSSYLPEPSVSSAQLENFTQTVFPIEKKITGFLNFLSAKPQEKTPEALYYFFSNQHDKISKAHIDAIKKYTSTFLVPWYTPPLFPKRPTLLSPTEALKHPVLSTYKPYLKRLISTCLSDTLAIDLVEKAIKKQLNLPSPFSADLAGCNESYETGAGLNCLRFTDSKSCFFLMQRISSADGLYFPIENVVIVFAYLQRIHINQLQQKILVDFDKIIDYSSDKNEFSGLIASHSRPGHFYYDIWPTLLEISRKKAIFAKIPQIVSRTKHDFVDIGAVLGSSKYIVADSESISRQTLTQHQYLIHVGLHRHFSQNKYRYEIADAFLVSALTKNPSLQISQLENKLAGCYPLVWIGIEGQKRCWLEQIEGYTFILNQLINRYPNLGVVFDGWTLPLTESTRAKAECKKDHLIVEKIVNGLNPAIKTISVVGETSQTKINIGNKIDFFITNFSSGSLHVSRLLGKPGFCHTSNKLANLSLKTELQIHPNNRVYLLPKSLVTDQILEGDNKFNTAINRHLRRYFVDELPESIEKFTTSYSIDKHLFYQFIEKKLPKILATHAYRQRFFLEIPFAVNPMLRQYLNEATYRKFLLVFPKLYYSELGNLTSFRLKFLRRHLIYGNFQYGCHSVLKINRAHYLIWLTEPLKRCYLNANLLLKRAEINGNKVHLAHILNVGHKDLDNYYTRVISGIDAPYGECTTDMLNQAITNLKLDFIFIGIDEKSVRSLNKLCQKLDLDRSLFPHALPKPGKFNETELSEEIKAKLQPLIKYDIMLYEAALKLA